MKASRLVFITLSIIFAAHAAAGAPISAVLPEKARSRIVETALSYAGAPYAYGGIGASGFDCSGLVYRVFLQSLGAVLPRTAREQYAYSEPIDASKIQNGDLLFFSTAGPISHVGIYEGEGRFVHAASEGPKKGVVVSSLSEVYWVKAFAGAGRIVPPAEYMGFILSASLRPSFGVACMILGVETELRPEYDARGGMLVIAGIEYAPFSFRAGTRKLGLASELFCNRYVSGGKAGLAKDTAAQIRAGLLLSTRWGT
jgi:hypothetical protein